MTATRGVPAGFDPAVDLHDNLVSDVLVLASVTSSVEGRLVDDWLARQERERPNSHIVVLRLPRGEPPSSVITRLAKQLTSEGELTVVPVRVFWTPAGLTGWSTLFAVLSGRDTYRPPRPLQRRVVRNDLSRARIVAGEAANVDDLERQWHDMTSDETREEFAAFVIRRARASSSAPTLTWTPSI
jgi:glycerol-3-phosphate O-acyltransferase